MCRSRTVYWKGSACRTYPSSFTPFVVIIWIALGCGDCELEMGGRSGDHLSPSILGTVLPQWAELIGMQRGLSLSLPPAFLPESLSLCSVWNRHSDEKQRGPKCFRRQGTWGSTRTHSQRTYDLFSAHCIHKCAFSGAASHPTISILLSSTIFTLALCSVTALSNEMCKLKCQSSCTVRSSQQRGTGERRMWGRS